MQRVNASRRLWGLRGIAEQSLVLTPGVSVSALRFAVTCLLLACKHLHSLEGELKEMQLITVKSLPPCLFEGPGAPAGKDERLDYSQISK